MSQAGKTYRKPPWSCGTQQCQQDSESPFPAAPGSVRAGLEIPCHHKLHGALKPETSLLCLQGNVAVGHIGKDHCVLWVCWPGTRYGPQTQGPDSSRGWGERDEEGSRAGGGLVIATVTASATEIWNVSRIGKWVRAEIHLILNLPPYSVREKNHENFFLDQYLLTRRSYCVAGTIWQVLDMFCFLQKVTRLPSLYSRYPSHASNKYLA